jgi:hypothetical protein
MLMLTNVRTAVAAAIMFSAASASAAKDGGPPTIDVQKTCRENVNALRTVLGGEIGQDESVCMSDERDAQQELIKNWADYPALAKSRCAQAKEYLPGYAEWLSCIQMSSDVLRLRKESASGASESSAGRRSSSRRTGGVTGGCPVVKYGEDGSIDYVINCPGLSKSGSR